MTTHPAVDSIVSSMRLVTASGESKGVICSLGRVITNHMLSSVIFLIASFACSLLLRPFQACDSKMKIAKPRKEKGEEGKRQIQCVVVRLTCVLPCPCRLLALSASKITIDRTVERRGKGDERRELEYEDSKCQYYIMLL